MLHGYPVHHICQEHSGGLSKDLRYFLLPILFSEKVEVEVARSTELTGPAVARSRIMEKYISLTNDNFSHK